MKVSKDSIDLCIVVKDEKAALAFYRDGLGMEDTGEVALPGGKLHRLRCGTSLIKLVKLEPSPAAAPTGGPMSALGYRYFAIAVPDIQGLMTNLEQHGIKPVMRITEFRPGVTIAMVEDPDGNTVEFLQSAEVE